MAHFDELIEEATYRLAEGIHDPVEPPNSPLYLILCDMEDEGLCTRDEVTQLNGVIVGAKGARRP